MSGYTEAGQALERFLVPLRPLIEAADKFKALGSLESEAEFLQGKVAESAAALAQLEPQVKAAQEAVTAAHEEAMGIVSRASEEAADKTRAAEADAADIRQRAVDGAAEVKRQAEDHAKTVRIAAERDRESTAAAVRKANAEVADAERRLGELQAELATLQPAVERAKRAAAALG